MQIVGYVIEENNNISKVAVYRSSACGDTCGKACATCKGASKMEVIANNGKYAPKLGEQVVLESKTNNVLKLALIVYVLPLIIAVIAFYIGTFIGLGEGFSALMALFGLAVGFIPALLVNKKIAKSKVPAHDVVDIVR